MTAIDTVATGRGESLFAADIADQRAALQARFAGRRLLVIGGAGSIGARTLDCALDCAPAEVVVLDQNENALADLMRDLRARPGGVGATRLRALPLDYGSEAARALIADGPPPDVVLHFAAIKHVRSEKDVFSVLQMIDTNLVKLARLIGWLSGAGFDGALFAVSTDKAANPTSFMGATKRVMEHVLFDLGRAALPQARITSARFANVAFSNGSLLQSFERRLALGQPLAAPRETRRYFVSREEAGQICALAAAAIPNGAVAVPALEPEAHLTLLADVATRFLRHHGFEAEICDDEAAAIAAAADGSLRRAGRWPLLLTPLDTVGEKPFEEFVADGETSADAGLAALRAVSRAAVDPAALRAVMDALAAMLSPGGAAALDKSAVKALIGRIEPAFLATHREAAQHLDDRL